PAKPQPIPYELARKPYSIRRTLPYQKRLSLIIPSIQADRRPGVTPAVSKAYSTQVFSILATNEHECSRMEPVKDISGQLRTNADSCLLVFISGYNSFSCVVRASSRAGPLPRL